MNKLKAEKESEKLEAKESFLHVVHEHRWLAVAGCTWNILQANNGSNEPRKEADRLLPDVVEAVFDSVLLHGRSLIDFYTKCKPSGTDIMLLDFDGLGIKTNLKENLEGYKKSIEVHSLHLTAWRHAPYRALKAKGIDANKKNLNWNEKIPLLVESILDALKCASERDSKWKPAFSTLHDACRNRYRDKRFPWPAELGEKDAVRCYLESLGIVWVHV